MTYSELLGEYKPTLYRDPLSSGKHPHKLSESDLQRVIDTCFTPSSAKQARFLVCIANATAASVGIKTHETRDLKYHCTYNNVADAVLIVNEKLKRFGYKFYIWAAKPSNKKSNDDSWLLWLVKDSNTQTTISNGEAA